MKNIIPFLLMLSLGLVTINCGGASHDLPNVQGSGEDGLEEPIVFATVRQNVFSKYGCLDCHAGARPSARIDLTTYDKLMLDPGLVDLTIDPKDTVLVKSMSSGDMPPRGPQVSSDDLNLLLAWIELGAPKD
jgi:hypothetical protein